MIDCHWLRFQFNQIFKEDDFLGVHNKVEPCSGLGCRRYAVGMTIIVLHDRLDYVTPEMTGGL